MGPYGVGHTHTQSHTVYIHVYLYIVHVLHTPARIKLLAIALLSHLGQPCTCDVHVQYRSRGTYMRVKKFTRVISTRHASGVTIFLEFEYSSARVQELECSSGLRVRGLESSSARTFARALAQKTVNRAFRWYD